MVLYECDKCKKIFKLKGDYTRHLNRKYKCEKAKSTPSPPSIHQNPPIFELVKNTKKEYKCEFCLGYFARADSLKRHYNRCKIKKETEIEKKEILDKLVKDFENMQKKNEEIEKKYDKIIKENSKLKRKIKNSTGINVNNKINCDNINITNNINVVAFGQEDIDKIITHDACKNLFLRGMNAIKILVEKIHFNEENPQYHNCYISNLRDKYAIIFDGKDWKLNDYQEVLEQLKINKEYFLRNKFQDMDNLLDEEMKKRFNNYLKNKDTDYVSNTIKESLKLLLYNKKKMIMETKNKSFQIK